MKWAKENDPIVYKHFTYFSLDEKIKRYEKKLEQLKKELEFIQPEMVWDSTYDDVVESTQDKDKKKFYEKIKKKWKDISPKETQDKIEIPQQILEDEHVPTERTTTNDKDELLIQEDTILEQDQEKQSVGEEPVLKKRKIYKHGFCQVCDQDAECYDYRCGHSVCFDCFKKRWIKHDKWAKCRVCKKSWYLDDDTLID